MIEGLAIVLVAGLFADRLFQRLRVPGLLGMILVGVVLGPHGLGMLDSALLRESADIRMIALIVILLRAGLGLNRESLARVGSAAVRMSAIPCLLEGSIAAAAAHLLLDLPWAEAGIMGFVLAAVSPAVVVPAMLDLREQGLGNDQGIPVLILAAASMDDVFAITVFGALLGLERGTGGSLVVQLVSIPWQIIGGIALGAALGYGLSRLFRARQVRMGGLEQAAALFCLALLTILLGEKLRIAGLLGVMAMGFVLLETSSQHAQRLEAVLGQVWFFAQVFLFVLIGAEVDVQVAWQAGLAGAVVILAGLAARYAGVLLALAGSPLSLNERLFCAVAYTPKATVQAAVAGIPLAAGVASGSVILAVAVLAIVLTAPLGTLGIRAAAPRLLEEDRTKARPAEAHVA